MYTKGFPPLFKYNHVITILFINNKPCSSATTSCASVLQHCAQIAKLQLATDLMITTTTITNTALETFFQKTKVFIECYLAGSVGVCGGGRDQNGVPCMGL